MRCLRYEKQAIKVFCIYLSSGDCLGVIHLVKASHWSTHQYLYTQSAEIHHSFLMSASIV